MPSTGLLLLRSLRRRAKLSIAVAMAAAIVLALILPNLHYLPLVGHVWVPGSASTRLTDVHSVQELQAHFNQDAGEPRLILLLSPT